MKATREQAREFAALIEQHVAERLRPLSRRCDALAARLDAVEQRKSHFYRGIWSEHETYEAHDFCTDRGSLWACVETGTRDRPGSSDAWQLAAKKGRDGR